MTVATNSKSSAEKVLNWSWSGDRYFAPKTYEDLNSQDFVQLITELSEAAKFDYSVTTVFPAEAANEEM